MKKAEFLQRYEELKAQVDAAFAEGNFTEANIIMSTAEALENEWHDEAVNSANAAALFGEATIADPFVNAAVADMTAAKSISKMEERKMDKFEMIASAEYKQAFLRNLQGKELNAEEMKMVVSAGAVIPTETVNKIYDFIREDPLLARITLMHIPGNVTIPVDNANADASWVAMGTASTDSSDSLTAVSLAAYKLIKTLEIGADVAAMAIPEFEGWLVATLGKKMRRALGAAVINGTGSGQPTGLTNLSAAGTYAKAGMTYKNLLTILGGLGADYAEGACLIMNRATFLAEVAGMVDSTGAPVVVRDVQDPMKLRVLDAEVVLTPAVTGSDVYYGNPENFVMNMASDITVKADMSVGFKTGSVCYRAMALADGKVLNANCFVKYTKSTT